MSRIKFEFDSDSGKAVKAMDRLQAELDKLIQQQQALAAASKKGGAAFEKEMDANTRRLTKVQEQLLKLQGIEKSRATKAAAGERSLANAMKGHAANLRSTITQYASVGAAVGIVTSAYSKWRQEMEALAESSEKLNASLVKNVASGGDLVNAPHVAEFVQTHPTATREQATAAYEGVTGAAPNERFQRRLDLASEATRVAPLGLELNKFSETLAKLATAMPNKSAGDLTDLTLSLSQKAGRDLSKLAEPDFLASTRILRDTGAVDNEGALAIGLESLDKNLTSEVLKSFATKLTGEIKLAPPPRNRAETALEKQLRQFAKADAATRLAMLEGNRKLQEKVLGGEIAASFGQLDLSKARQRAETLRQDQRGDYVGRQLTQLAKTPEGQEAIADQRLAKEVDVSGLKEERAGRQLEDARKKLGAIMRKDGLNPVRRFFGWMNFEIHNLINEIQGEKNPALEALQSTTTEGIDFQFFRLPIRKDDRATKFIREQERISKAFELRDRQRAAGQPLPPIVEAAPPTPPKPQLPPPESEPEPVRRQRRLPVHLGPSRQDRRDGFADKLGQFQGGRSARLMTEAMQEQEQDKLLEKFKHLEGQTYRPPERPFHLLGPSLLPALNAGERSRSRDGRFFEPLPNFRPSREESEHGLLESVANRWKLLVQPSSDRQLKLLEEMLEEQRKSRRSLEELGKQGNPDRSRLAVARSAAADRNRHTES